MLQCWTKSLGVRMCSTKCASMLDKFYCLSSCLVSMKSVFIYEVFIIFDGEGGQEFVYAGPYFGRRSLNGAVGHRFVGGHRFVDTHFELWLTLLQTQGRGELQF